MRIWILYKEHDYEGCEPLEFAWQNMPSTELLSATDYLNKKQAGELRERVLGTFDNKADGLPSSFIYISPGVCVTLEQLAVFENA